MSEKNRRAILNQIKRHEDRLFTDWYQPFKREKQYRSIFMKAVRELPVFLFENPPTIREVEQARLGGDSLPMMTLVWGGLENTDAGTIKALPLGPYLLIDRGPKGTPKRYNVSLYLPHERVVSGAYRAMSWVGRLTNPKKIELLDEQIQLGLFARL